ncbi:MAG: alanyl-tRNA editing protein [Candidatus Eiseniibacteriota bacterium]
MSGTGEAHIPRPYLEDPYTTAFEATVRGVREDERGVWIALERSYFYPTGGGQESDRGTIGRAAVVDVEEADDGTVWHRIERADGEASMPLPGASLPATIDAGRRLGFRQQHTGQHVLSQAFERVLDAYTVSSRLGEFEGTIDLDRGGLTWDDVERTEEAANRVVFEDRPVRTVIVGASEIGQYPLRKPPKVEGSVRLVIVEDWDVSPCGGTHCTKTGEIGPIKVRRFEKWKGGTRVEFVCGVRALADYQDRVRMLVEAGLRQHTSDREVIDVLERAAAERAALSKTVKRLGEQLAELEAAAWAVDRGAALDGGDSGDGANVHGWARRLAERDAAGLKAFALAAVKRGAPFVVAAALLPEPALVIVRARERSEPDLREVTKPLLAVAQGKGGGGPDLLTIVAKDAAALEAAYVEALRLLGIPAESGS